MCNLTYCRWWINNFHTITDWWVSLFVLYIVYSSFLHCCQLLKQGTFIYYTYYPLNLRFSIEISCRKGGLCDAMSDLSDECHIFYILVSQLSFVVTSPSTSLCLFVYHFLLWIWILLFLCLTVPHHSSSMQRPRSQMANTGKRPPIMNQLETMSQWFVCCYTISTPQKKPWGLCERPRVWRVQRWWPSEYIKHLG